MIWLTHFKAHTPHLAVARGVFRPTVPAAHPSPNFYCPQSRVTYALHAHDLASHQVFWCENTVFGCLASGEPWKPDRSDWAERNRQIDAVFAYPWPRFAGSGRHCPPERCARRVSKIGRAHV